jgi:maleate isomerase
MISRRGLWRTSMAAGLVACAGPRSDRSGASPTAGGRPPAPVRSPTMPAIAESGMVHDGTSIGIVGLNPAIEYPDVRSYRTKLGLIIPATNTSMEHELWTLIGRNPHALQGVGIHTSNVVTPRPQLRTKADLVAYKEQFLSGLGTAIDQALLAQPDYLVMGMSLEHILHGLGEVRAAMNEAHGKARLPWAAWHDAAPAALAKLGAKRIGLLTPFDRAGNENAARMFEDLGFDVVTTFGFACANALHIAHVPDDAKELAIREYLVTPTHRLDAVVQCGTNMSLLDVTERLEPVLGIPILGINAVLFWHALRENGFDAPLAGGGRLLRGG